MFNILEKQYLFNGENDVDSIAPEIRKKEEGKKEEGMTMQKPKRVFISGTEDDERKGNQKKTGRERERWWKRRSSLLLVKTKIFVEGSGKHASGEMMRFTLGV